MKVIKVTKRVGRQEDCTFGTSVRCGMQLRLQVVKHGEKQSTRSCFSGNGLCKAVENGAHALFPDNLGNGVQNATILGGLCHAARDDKIKGGQGGTHASARGNADEQRVERLDERFDARGERAEHMVEGEFYCAKRNLAYDALGSACEEPWPAARGQYEAPGRERMGVQSQAHAIGGQRERGLCEGGGESGQGGCGGRGEQGGAGRGGGGWTRLGPGEEVSQRDVEEGEDGGVQHVARERGGGTGVEAREAGQASRGECMVHLRKRLAGVQRVEEDVDDGLGHGGGEGGSHGGGKAG